MNLCAKIIFEKVAYSGKWNLNAWVISPSSEKETDNKVKNDVTVYDTSYLTARNYLELKSKGNFPQDTETSHNDSSQSNKEQRNIRNNESIGESMWWVGKNDINMSPWPVVPLLGI